MNDLGFDGGPMHPTLSQRRGGTGAEEGASVRTWLFGQALIGLLAGRELPHDPAHRADAQRLIVRDALAFADLGLLALELRPPEPVETNGWHDKERG